MSSWLAAAAEAETEPLRSSELYRRVWTGGWFLLASLLVLALGEVVARPGENPTVSALQLLTTAGVAIGLAAVWRARTAGQVIAVAVLVELWCGAGSAAIAVATGHSSTSLIVLVALSAGAAAFLPWGWRPQAVVAVWLSAMFPLEIVVGGMGPLHESSRELVALVVINAGSVFVARELERQRRLIGRERAERRARERELEQQRAFLRQVIDINPHLVFAKDRAGRFTLVNQAVANVYGVSVDELTGRCDADFNANPDEVAHFRRDDLEVMDSGRERVIAEEPITDAAGQQRWLRTIKRALAVDGGPADQVLGVATDITEQKAAAAALEENAALAAELARFGEGIIAGLNRPDLLEHLCRLTRDALAADSVQMWLLDAAEGLYRPACRAGDPAARWEVIRLLTVPCASVDAHRVAAERRGAAWIPAAELAMPYRLLAEGLRGILWIALRRGGEPAGALLASYRESASPGPAALRVANGIAQLASLALENARLLDELQRANSLKSEFMATMSHELRTPLNVIIGYGTLLLEGAMGDLAAEQRATLQRIQANAVQLFELISATLDVSRLEAGRLPIDLQPVNLSALVDEVATRTRDQRERSGVAFEQVIDDGIGAVVTDAAKLRIILTNLVGNAFKFTAQGQVRLSVRDAGDAVEIAVSDTGIGIPPQVQQAIFEPFRQADATIGSRYGGVGLGLFIVRRLVEALGGEVGIESAVGRGSIFRIRLPKPARVRRARR
ncbi:MAG: PAS domain-containing sensor histidine kinase [Candidatus Binatia bacterium]